MYTTLIVVHICTLKTSCYSLSILFFFLCRRCINAKSIYNGRMDIIQYIKTTTQTNHNTMKKTANPLNLDECSRTGLGILLTRVLSRAQHHHAHLFTSFAMEIVIASRCHTCVRETMIKAFLLIVRVRVRIRIQTFIALKRWFYWKKNSHFFIFFLFYFFFFAESHVCNMTFPTCECVIWIMLYRLFKIELALDTFFTLQLTFVSLLNVLEYCGCGCVCVCECVLRCFSKNLKSGCSIWMFYRLSAAEWETKWGAIYAVRYDWICVLEQSFETHNIIYKIIKYIYIYRRQ